MRMRQSLAQLEQEFLFQQELTQQEQEQMQRTAQVRSRQRWHAKQRKSGTKRFYLLACTLVLTAVLVTVVMFATLYLLLV